MIYLITKIYSVTEMQYLQLFDSLICIFLFLILILYNHSSIQSLAAHLVKAHGTQVENH
jgi:hypothetical protein